MPYFFAPPVVYDRPLSYPPGTERVQPHKVDVTTNRMFSRFGGQARGRTVLKEAGVYSTVDTPDANRVAAAEVVYLGGHQYEVPLLEAVDLIAAGYTVYESTPAGSAHGEYLVDINANLVEVTLAILSEAGDIIITEDGTVLVQEA